jgi:hypothetical protein
MLKEFKKYEEKKINLFNTLQDLVKNIFKPVQENW